MTDNADHSRQLTITAYYRDPSYRKAGPHRTKHWRHWLRIESRGTGHVNFRLHDRPATFDTERLLTYGIDKLQIFATSKFTQQAVVLVIAVFRSQRRSF